MTTFVPDGIMSKLKGSELKAAEILRRLDDDCLVYYEPAIGGCRYPDYVVILPRVGVLVIEVKGWKITDIIKADGYSVFHRQFQRLEDPLRQARNYTLKLMDCARNSALSKFLVNCNVQHTNKFAFPFSWVTFFCNIAREEFESNFPGHFPANKNVARDELERLRHLKGQELEKALSQYFDPIWPIEPMSEAQTDAIRHVIHPSSAINSLQVLDVVQEQLSYQIGGGHRLVYGPAGTGKTVILIARARKHSLEGGGPVLVLCYNRLLRRYIKKSLQNYASIEVLTFHAWAKRNGVEMIMGEEPEAHAARLLQRFQDGLAPDVGRYYAVLIDEVQYCVRDWLRCAESALAERNPSKANLFVTGDGTQNYFRRNFTWKESGINITGRTRVLRKNYRNTRQILDVAQTIGPLNSGSGGDLPTDVADPGNAQREGPRPLIKKFENRLLEVEYVAALVRRLLCKGVKIRDRRVCIIPSDIGIIYRKQTKLEKEPMQTLIARIGEFSKIVRLTPPRVGIDIDLEGVKLLTAQSCTGLQFKCVIVIWADQFSGEAANVNERALLYAALTRAEELLIVTHSFETHLLDAMRNALAGKKMTH